MFYGRKKKCSDGKRNPINGAMKGPKKETKFQEAQSNGTLFDRIMSLENQLTQLSMEIDCKTAYPSSCDASSNSGYKIAERICSYPTFNNPLAANSMIRRNPLPVDINKKKSQNSVRQPQMNGNHKTSSNTRRKSKIASSWPKMRLLGC